MATRMKPDLCSRISAAIKSAGMTKSAAAKALGVTPQALTGWTKDGKISITNLYQLAMLTGKTMEWFMAGSFVRNPVPVPSIVEVEREWINAFRDECWQQAAKVLTADKAARERLELIESRLAALEASNAR